MDFKEIRTIQHITLSDASKGICSVPMLSRWENNQGHMDFNKAIKLLERVNIKSSEYIALNNLDISDNEARLLEIAWEDKSEKN